MTEAVQLDSSEESGTTDEVENDGVIDLGADLEAPSEAPPIEEPTSTDSAPADRATTADAPDRPASINIDADLESIPEQLRPLARQLKGDYTQKSQALAQQQREVEALYQQQRIAAVEQQQQGLSARVDAASPEADPFAAVRARLAPEEQGALDTMREVIKADVGQTLTTQGQQVEQLTNAVRQLAVHVVQQATQAQNATAVAAREQYPDIDTYQAQINALTAVPNPATSKNYTPAEAYELVTGIAGQKSAQFQNGQKQVRRNAASNASSSPSVAAESDSGALSEAALVQKLEALGLKA